MSEPAATSATPSTTDELVCRRCSKPQSELPNPLKRCAKCQSVNYCSRACQQAHWSNHKKACRAKVTERDQSLNNPTKEKILQEAKQTNDLLRACTTHPLFTPDEPTLRRTHPTLWNVMDFLRRTWNDYVLRLVSPKASIELRSSSAGAGADPETLPAELLQELRHSSNADVWPPFDEETYTDIITRNMTIAMIILDRGGRQVMFGGLFDFGEEAKNIARAITGRP